MRTFSYRFSKFPLQRIGALEIARHYVRELVYGANDGIITTFAIVAGVAGGGLSLHVVVIVGVANLLADGLSMAAGNYLSIRTGNPSSSGRFCVASTLSCDRVEGRL